MIKLVYFLAFMFLAGCSKAEKLSLESDISQYQSLVGSKLSDLKAAFGEKSITPFALSLHEPESSLSGYQIDIDDVSFFAMGRDTVEALLFRDRFFKTSRGVNVGRGYCEIIALYPKAEFYFGFEEGAVLQLNIASEALTLSFDTSSLPIGNYITSGMPRRDDKSLCTANLFEITLGFFSKKGV